MPISSHSLQDDKQRDSPFLINRNISQSQSQALQDLSPSDAPLTDEELQALQDPQFREFFKNVLEKPELSEQLSKTLNQSQQHPVGPSHSLVPDSGFVVKTLVAETTRAYPQSTKVFINICHSTLIPSPPLISDSELLDIIQAQDPSRYRIPLSLAGPTADTDKSDRVCIVFDVCVNSNTFTKTSSNPDFTGFLVELGLQWIENKHDLVLSRNYVIPKMASKGALQTHVIKRAKQVEISVIEKKKDIVYTVVLSDDKKSIQDSIKECELDVESRLLSLKVIGDSLKVKLERNVIIESSSAEFHWATKTLIVRLGVE